MLWWGVIIYSITQINYHKIIYNEELIAHEQFKVIVQNRKQLLNFL